MILALTLAAGAAGTVSFRLANHLRVLATLADENAVHLLFLLEHVIAPFTMHLDQPFQEAIAVTGGRPSVPAGRFVASLPRA
jgi:hypothetical protein